ncbi:hypothetical protein AN1V17_11660 [Vallitalea sediminicola]
MSDRLGVKEFCSKCQYSIRTGKYIMCSNRKSSFFGKPVNCILCAPCFTEGKTKEYSDLVSLINVIYKLLGYGKMLDNLNMILKNNEILTIADLEKAIENEIPQIIADMD